jgi:hypothetical protein
MRQLYYAPHPADPQAAPKHAAAPHRDLAQLKQTVRSDQPSMLRDTETADNSRHPAAIMRFPDVQLFAAPV